MEVYDQIVDPTAVSHSLSCHFTSADTEDLVVVKNTLLQLFTVSNGKLILHHEYKLQGQVLDISIVRLRNSPLDHLIILTKFAKVSIVGFDTAKNTISTTSLHYYESELQKRHINELTTSHLRIDPKSRAALCYHRDMLAFLPFITEDSLEDDVASTDLYYPSIVIPSGKLDTQIHNIVDCQFLHDYREPTLAVIYNNELTWAADLTKAKDTVNLVVLNLDLTTGSSTPIVNVEKLPYDIWKIVSLPMSGLLLVGCNELIHVDNSGNTRGIGVNSFYKSCTDFKQLEDQSQLELFLEDSVLEVIGSQVFITDKTNKMYVLSFNRDGKVIKGLKLSPVDLLLPYGLPSTVSLINQYIFVGCSTADSVLLKTKISDNSAEKKHKTDIEEGRESTEDKMNEDDDDENLYGGDDYDDVKTTGDIPLEFEVVDTLINNGSISSFTLGCLSPDATVQGAANPNYNDVSIIATSGEGHSGKLTCFHATVQPIIHSSLKFQNISRSWNLLNKYLITTDLSNFKSEIFLINDNFKTFQTLDFRNNNITVEIAYFELTKRIVQVTSTSVFLYDHTFKRLVSVNADFEILNAKFYEPYVVLTSSKGEIRIFEVETKGRKQLTKVRLPQALDDFILTFGTICNSQILSSGTKRNNENEIVRTTNPVFLVTTVKNEVLLFNKNHEEKVYQLTDLNKLPEMTKLREFEPQQGLVPDPFLKEIHLMFMGDSHHKEEIMTVLTVGGEVIMYRVVDSTTLQKLDSNIFTGAPENIFAQATIIERKLLPFTVDDISYLFVTGKQPYVVMKSRTAMPKIFKFTHTSLISMCQFEGKFMAIDEAKNARVCSIPIDETHNYSNNLPVEVVAIGMTVNNVTFHDASKLLVVSTLTEIPYVAKDEEGLDIVGTEEEKRKATSFKSSIKLIKPTGWVTIDEVNFDDDTVINCLKSLELTISSRSKKKKEFIVFGVGKYRMEDLTVFGEYHIHDPISIVPDPEHPEVDYKLKEIAKEVVKGAVTSITEISGRFLASQGQKIIVRDLQQDNSTVPVAFLDTATYLSDSKSFENLVLVGDTLKNIWFLGFDAEPYRLFLLGKSLNKLDVSACDFLVSNGEVYFLVADDEGTLNIIAYDPDDVKSLSGQRLLNKTTLHINTLTTTMRMVPKHEEFKDGRSFQVIGANTDGSLFKVTPIDEFSYRRLYILQQQMSEKLNHYCGLNPKANRYHFSESGVKPVIDYELIRRFFYLNVEKRLQFSGKVGKTAYLEIWRDMIEIENSLNNMHSV